MSENSKIEWCNHTFNPWWGCAKVPGDPACHNCYAEALARRTGHRVWGVSKSRRELSETNWSKPAKWNRSAAERGVRERVFCSSMADVFEDRRDLDPLRARLWQLIDETPSLDWLVLTKRPENFGWIPQDMSRQNLWLGVTAVTQRHWDDRVPLLMEEECAVRFVSAEPMMERIQIRDRVDWLIFGGESGPGARMCDAQWIKDGIEQCHARGIAPFVKQLGARTTIDPRPGTKGQEFDRFPPALQHRFFPTPRSFD